MQNERFYLKEWREERELSQPKLAAKLIDVVDIRTIQNIEGEPSEPRQGRVIRALEKALDLPPGGLRKPPHSPTEPELPDFEERMKGRVTIDGIELTEEEKQKIVAMAKILKGGA